MEPAAMNRVFFMREWKITCSMAPTKPHSVSVNRPNST